MSELEDDVRGQVLTFEEFYHSYYKGAILPHAGAFSSAVARMSGIALKGAQTQHKQDLRDYANERYKAREAFDGLISKGVCREPTRWENLQARAASHPDHRATQAARRLLLKYRDSGVDELQGIRWEWEDSTNE